MRLHRLTMTAIGPFVSQVELDFARLGEGGLFLLEGPTGSGKSTIIDAISFALYGKVAQASGAVERIKSHHAAAGTEPVVELVFETQSGLFRIRRTPSYERPKARGSGTVTTNMSVKVFRLTNPDDLDGGQLLSNRIGDAEDEITRAVGLTHAQFVQTVVLPQGEFASFLRSDTNTKRALLQRLFGTELLARTQELLAAGRRVAMQRREAAAIAINSALRSFLSGAEIVGDQADQLAQLAIEGEHDALTAHVRQAASAATAAAEAAARRNKAAQGRRSRSERACQHALEVGGRRERRDMLRSRERELQAANGLHEAARGELAAADRALAVVPAADLLATAISRLDTAQSADATARSALPNGLAEADESQLRAAAASRLTSIGALADDIRREQQLAELHVSCTQLERQHRVLTATASTIRTQLESLPERVASLTTELDDASAAAAQLGPLVEEHERTEKRLRAAQRAVVAERQAREEEQITIAALGTLQDHQQRLSVLRSTRVISIAGELGLKLQAGDPCQVCGSVEHPRPATPGRNHVTEAQVRTAETELARLSTAAEACRQQLEQQRLELRELQVEADSMTPEHAQVRLDDVAARLKQARTAAARQRQVADELLTVQSRAAELANKLHGVELNRAGLAERLSALRERIDADLAMVTATRGEYASIADLVQALTDEVRRLQAAATAAAAAAAATTTAVEAGNGFTAALGATGFADQAEWQQAHRTSAELATLRAHVKAIDADWAGIHAGLAEPALNDPELDDDPPDLAALAESLKQAEAEAEAAAEDSGSARERAQVVSEAADVLILAMAAGRQIMLDTGPAIRLGNLVSGNGDNQLKMELTTYVLVRRFAEIVSAANVQLRRVSGGRYELQHTDAKSGNARSGLGLLVLDLHTGRTRDPATLSGGETFYVSLSLALGLADVVRAESGGLDLGTLFIDEGFGSLDPEVLDGVMSVLDSLRAGGRAVGVVSHVAELKARISDQVTVRPNPDGSSSLRVTA